MDPTVKESPLISVVMPVYNAEEYIGEAIKSILNQSFADFELLIFNDGSTDNSLHIINSYKDSRIKVHHFENNKGYLAHLNEGIDLALGVYLARMDADDISVPERFQMQVAVLNENPEIGVCGSWVKLFGGSNRIVRYPEHNDEIKINLLSQNSFAHPSVMIRKEVLISNKISYRQEFYTSEDYKMWVDLVPFTKFYNIPKVLLKYRATKNQITSKFNHLQLELSTRIKLSQLSYFRLDPSEVELELHINIVNKNISDVNDLKKMDVWMDILKGANRKSGFYEQSILSNFFEELKNINIRFFVLNQIYRNKNKNLILVNELLFSEHRFYSYLTFCQKIKFIGKFLLKK